MDHGPVVFLSLVDNEDISETIFFQLPESDSLDEETQNSLNGPYVFKVDECVRAFFTSIHDKVTTADGRFDKNNFRAKIFVFIPSEYQRTNMIHAKGDEFMHKGYLIPTYNLQVNDLDRAMLAGNQLLSFKKTPEDKIYMANQNVSAIRGNGVVADKYGSLKNYSTFNVGL